MAGVAGFEPTNDGVRGFPEEDKNNNSEPFKLMQKRLGMGQNQIKIGQKYPKSMRCRLLHNFCKIRELSD